MTEKTQEKERNQYRFDIKVQNVFHVGGKLVHHREVAEDTGSVSDDDGPHTRRRQDTEPRDPVRLWIKTDIHTVAKNAQYQYTN